MPTAGLNLYNGLNGGDVNGTWTLFIADLPAGGGSPTFNQAVLTIITVPEPQTIALSLLWASWFGSSSENAFRPYCDSKLARRRSFGSFGRL
jgi:hypothetical protein